METRVLLFQNDSVHPVDRPVVIASREEFLTLNCTSHNIAYKGVLLRKVCGEVHLLPLEALADSEAGKAEVGTNGLAFHEIKKTV